MVDCLVHFFLVDIKLTVALTRLGVAMWLIVARSFQVAIELIVVCLF